MGSGGCFSSPSLYSCKAHSYALEDERVLTPGPLDRKEALFFYVRLSLFRVQTRAIVLVRAHLTYLRTSYLCM